MLLSVVATLGGTLLVLAGIRLLDGARNTDFGDAKKSITSMSESHRNEIAIPAVRFTDVASDVGLQMVHGPGIRQRLLTEDSGSGLAWGDYDDDGDYDLYVVNLHRHITPQEKTTDLHSSNRLFRNDEGTFVDVTDTAQVADPGSIGMGAWFVDIDEDQDLDLYVTNYGPNRLFENQGNGTFVENARVRGIDDDAWSTGVTWGDFDRDGHLDFYVCNYLKYEDLAELRDSAMVSGMGSTTVPFALNPNSFEAAPNRLYRNLGNGRFEDVAEKLGVDDPQGKSLTATFCDLDGDGRLDLYVNNDVSTNRCFLNRCGEHLAE